MPRTEYDDPEAEKTFQNYLPRLNEGVSVAEKDNRPGKGDKVENQTKREDRYGDGYGINQSTYRSRRDAQNWIQWSRC